MIHTQLQQNMLFGIRTALERAQAKENDIAVRELFVPKMLFEPVVVKFQWYNGLGLSDLQIVKEIIGLLNPAYQHYFDTVFVRNYIRENFDKIILQNHTSAVYGLTSDLFNLIEAVGMKREPELYDQWMTDIFKIQDHLIKLNNSKELNELTELGYIDQYSQSQKYTYKPKFKSHNEYNRYVHAYSAVYEMLDGKDIALMDQYLNFLTELKRMGALQKPEWFENHVVFFQNVTSLYFSMSFKGTEKEKMHAATFLAKNASVDVNGDFLEIPHYTKRVFGRCFEEFKTYYGSVSPDELVQKLNEVITQRAAMNQKYHN